MKFLASFVVLTLFSAALALAQQPPRPNAQQILEQIMEGEIANYRRQLSQLADQVNKLTDELDVVKKETKDCPSK